MNEIDVTAVPPATLATMLFLLGAVEQKHTLVDRLDAIDLDSEAARAASDPAVLDQMRARLAARCGGVETRAQQDALGWYVAVESPRGSDAWVYVTNQPAPSCAAAWFLALESIRALEDAVRGLLQGRAAGAPGQPAKTTTLEGNDG